MPQAANDIRRYDVTRVIEAPIEKGTVLAGKYEVDCILAAGGMGMIVRAKHVCLDQTVAIKLLLPGTVGPERVARFEREARAIAKIKGDHVARALDLGTLDDGMPYLAMEYLEGEDLDQRLRRRGPLGVEEAIDFVVQACEAMAEAHALGIVHRDLKSSNLFVTRLPDGSERIKVLDFGIAKVEEPEDSRVERRVTRTLAVMGSPTYMSPEQLKSARDVDERTDVWALGVIVYELLTGKVPFEGNDLLELYSNIVSAPPLPIDRADVPRGLEEVIAKCLAKATENRFDGVAALAQALSSFGSSRAKDAAERALRITKAAQPGSDRTASRSRIRRLKPAALAAFVALLALGAIRGCGESARSPASRAESPAAAP